jgi:hypothetical protein
MGRGACPLDGVTIVEVARQVCDGAPYYTARTADERHVARRGQFGATVPGQAGRRDTRLEPERFFARQYHRLNKWNTP